MHQDGKWAQQILAAQNADGSWHGLHGMAQPVSGKPLTTEQALRRLERLGCTREDACIQRALAYLHGCLDGTAVIPDPVEKGYDWRIFTELIASTWIRRFMLADALANGIAVKWAEVVTAGFAGGTFDLAAYQAAYLRVLQPAGGQVPGAETFYPVSLVAGLLDPDISAAYVTHLLHFPRGVYYVYDQPLDRLPGMFQSKQTSRYLAAIELLVAFPHGREQLSFVADWLENHRTTRSTWDLGGAAADGVYAPLSDHWRSAALREADCTERISSLLRNLRGE